MPLPPSVLSSVPLEQPCSLQVLGRPVGPPVNVADAVAADARVADGHHAAVEQGLGRRLCNAEQEYSSFCEARLAGLLARGGIFVALEK